ncbi:MAG: ADP-glyceromanno-heptose 6-epimerase [Ferruginibacter sp.]
MQSLIIVTGAAGFIGSCLTGFLNDNGFENLILVDDFSITEKNANLSDKKYIEKIERENLFEWLENNNPIVDFFFHIGARTDTTEFDYSIHQHLNVDYSIKVWEYCREKKVSLVYASSAATYGDGSLGYNDTHEIVKDLKPLNPYGISKNEFDKYAISKIKEKSPPHWYGLKFFNVYGPNEYHKGRMASVIFHAYNQIIDKGSVKLFKSHKDKFKDGEQLRDFIYVKDVLKVCFWLMQNAKSTPSGLYNLGTGEARTFNDLVTSTFNASNKPVNIEYIDMPEDIRESYQYFTEANMAKLKAAGYTDNFYSLEKGVTDYVTNYLKSAHNY